MMQTCFGDAVRYAAVHGDMPEQAEFDRLQAVASRMVTTLCGARISEAAAGSDAVRAACEDAVHWQIWFMRRRGSLEACLSDAPQKESFAGYTVERPARGGECFVGGIAACPMMLSVLRTAGLLGCWI